MSKQPGKKATWQASKQSMVMERSYQKLSGVAAGVEIRGGGRQVTVTFTAEQFEALAKRADKAGVSFAEQVRRAVNETL